MAALNTESDPESYSLLLSFRPNLAESADNPAMKQSKDQSVKQQYITVAALNMTEIGIKAALAKLQLGPLPNTAEQIPNIFHSTDK